MHSATQDDLRMHKCYITHSQIHQSIWERRPQHEKTMEQKSKFFYELQKSEQSHFDL